MANMTEKELIEILKKRLKYGVKQSYIAKQLGVSCSHLSEVLNGKKSIGVLIPEKLGYEVVYRRKK